MMRKEWSISVGMREASVGKVSGAYRSDLPKMPPRLRYSGPLGEISTMRILAPFGCEAQSFPKTAQTLSLWYP